MARLEKLDEQIKKTDVEIEKARENLKRKKIRKSGSYHNKKRLNEISAQ